MRWKNIAFSVPITGISSISIWSQLRDKLFNHSNKIAISPSEKFYSPYREVKRFSFPENLIIKNKRKHKVMRIVKMIMAIIITLFSMLSIGILYDIKDPSSIGLRTAAGFVCGVIGLIFVIIFARNFREEED